LNIDTGDTILAPMLSTTPTYAVFETAGGFCGIAWSDAGVSRFQLPTATARGTERLLLRRMPDARPGPPPPEIAGVIEAVKRYFAGEDVDFSGVRLDLDGQSDLFRDIYAALRRVGWGQTTTYGALAKAAGASGWEAAREVGQAMARNPVALIIPCHRCLAAGGRIGGFSAPGGEFSKLKMLELEGVRLEAGKPSKPDQPSLF
jgi:methylated-DNA-[protein]-cysteine S-methyltransferase